MSNIPPNTRKTRDSNKNAHPGLLHLAGSQTRRSAAEVQAERATKAAMAAQKKADATAKARRVAEIEVQARKTQAYAKKHGNNPDSPARPLYSAIVKSEL